MKITFKNTVVLTSAVMILSLAACTPSELTEGGQSSAGGTTISYALWDPNQKLVYEKCATQFTEETGIRVKIEQSGWDDYWQNLSLAFNGGTAPDVFTNHVAHYPELASKGVLTDLNTNLANDPVDFNQYTGNLASLWEHDGKRYSAGLGHDRSGV